MIALYVEIWMYGVNVEDIWQKTSGEISRSCLVVIATRWSLHREWVENVVTQVCIQKIGKEFTADASGFT